VLILSISTGNVHRIIQDLGYSSVCWRWVSRSLTFKHNSDRRAISYQLAHFEAEGEPFLPPLVTADDTWVHHAEPETKSNLWDGTILSLSPWKEKSETYPLVNKVITTVFWECESVIYIDAMPRGESIISDAYIMMLTEVRNHFEQVQRHKINLLSG